MNLVRSSLVLVVFIPLAAAGRGDHT